MASSYPCTKKILRANGKLPVTSNSFLSLSVFSVSTMVITIFSFPTIFSNGFFHLSLPRLAISVGSVQDLRSIDRLFDPQGRQILFPRIGGSHCSPSPLCIVSTMVISICSFPTNVFFQMGYFLCRCRTSVAQCVAYRT